MRIKLWIVVALLILISGCKQDSRHTYTLFQYDARIDSVIQQMSLEEKVAMMHGKHMFVSAGVERLGIADMKYADGPFGIREELQPDGWVPLGWEKDSATFFPTGSALAATWSPDLAYEYGKALAKEARMRGKDMLLGPAINIQRIPTGGRTYEYLSEDPYLSSRLAVGYTRGVQENGVAACLKHYALNNQENNRGQVNVVIGERAMREVYLPPFHAAVTEAGAYGVMAAYNKVNGFWCAENEVLLDQILRREWGFAGMVISDWSGTHSTVGSAESGLNVEMPGKKFLGQALLDSVRSGIISEEIINRRVREILRVRMAIEPVPEDQANLEITSRPASQRTAYRVACKSIVLLENDGILPLDLSGRPHIAVIGDNAIRTMATGGVGAGVKALYEVTPLEGLKNRIGDRAEISFAGGYLPYKFDWARARGRKTTAEIEREDIEREKLNKKLNDKAIELASKADIVIFIGGNNRSLETESSDRKDILLPSGQDELIREVARVNPNLVTVLVSGAPNDLNTVKEVSNALMISWFNGSEGGNALADILCGDISPGGRLPFTIPFKLEDSPAFAPGNYPQGKKGKDVFVHLVEEDGKSPDKQSGQAANVPGNDPNTACYSEGSLVGYRWYDTREIPVMYPFGYGLGYSTFEYSSLQTDKDSFGRDDVIKFSLNLQNTGSAESDEVVQAYIHRLNSRIEWPYKELKGFSRVHLQPGKHSRAELSIRVSDLFYWNESNGNWTYDSCDIELQVGASAGDIRLVKKLTLK